MPYIIYFNKKPTNRNLMETWDTIEGEFFLYKFKTKEKTFQLFSTKKLHLGEYELWGNEIEILDYLDLGNTSQIGKKLPLYFVHSAFSKENEIQTKEEFFERFKQHNLTEEKFITWLYTSANGWIHKYPRSFALIQIANFLGCADEFNTFHLPVLMISNSGTGKTTATELIFNRMNEIEKFTNLNSSTLKGVVPSFKSSTELKPGLFLDSNRYAPLDEFFSGIINLHSDEKEKTLENVKNLLDYQERAHRSGHGVINGQMKAEHIALTNPKYFGNTMLQLSNKIFPENLTRYLVWYIKDSQIKFIEDQVGKREKGEFSFISKEDFLEGIDFLKTFNCEFDLDKVKEIYDIGKHFLAIQGSDYERLRATYSSRYRIHVYKLLDALTKFRCWVEGDQSFKAKKEDYDLVRELWIEMLENWNIGFLRVEYLKTK